MSGIETTLHFNRPDSISLLFTGIVLAAGIWHYRFLRRSRPARLSAAVTAARVSALLLILFCIFEPSLLRARGERIRPTLAIAVDRSRSMRLGEPDGPSRLERVGEFLESSSFSSVADQYYPSYYAFADDLARLDRGDLPALQPGGRGTDLAGAIRSATAEGDPSLGAVIVFTDGGHNGGLPGPGEGAENHRPVIYVGTGEEAPIADVEIAAVEGSDMAFAGRPVRFSVSVRAQGFQGRSFPLLLKQSGRVILSRDLNFSSGKGEKTVDLTWTPQKPGQYHLSFEIPPQAGEPVRDNNRVDRVLDVARDKIRILLVSGRPSWTHRFLRDAFKGDPSVDLVSFIILRTATDAVNVSQDELSLIPFPTKKIFLEELPNFDLVVFENFSHRFYFPAQYLEKVREFTEGGGGFWMLGGPLAFIGGGYAGSPLEKVLPVELYPLPPGEGYVREQIVASFTAAGKRHPFFDGLGDLDPSDLPSFDGYNLSGNVMENAVTLAEFQGNDGTMHPLIALGRYGKGRVMSVLTGSLWKWNFEMAGQGRGNFFFLSFVRQAVRWSVGDPQVLPLVVDVEDQTILPGDMLRARIRVLGEDYLPTGDPELRVLLRSADGREKSLSVRSLSPGTFLAEGEVTGEGTFILDAAVWKGGTEYARTGTPITVTWPVEELSQPGLNRLNLEEAARLGKGHFIELGTAEETGRRLGEILKEIAPPYHIEFEEQKGLGQEWWAFALIVALLSMDWLLRRRYGLD